MERVNTPVDDVLVSIVSILCARGIGVLPFRVTRALIIQYRYSLLVECNQVQDDESRFYL